MTSTRRSLPTTGKTLAELKAQMGEAGRLDAKWRQGRIGGLVYFANDDILKVAQKASSMFFSENALGPRAFPSLKRFETDVVDITAMLLRGEGAQGNITSGGTESILLGVKTARDRARAELPDAKTPEMILPVTAHPAFHKAAHYFGLTPIRIPVREDYRADIAALEAALTENTVLIVGSAPSFPHGVIDPISEMGRIAEAHGISLHVDACVGGFMLPFLRRLGYPVPDFDFRTPGVTSISADLHKYAFAAKGASTILHRNADLYQYQGFMLRDYSMGTYRTPTIAGTRPGGPIAAAWAVLHYLGEEGYLRIAQATMDVARRMMREINATSGLHVWGKPDMSVFAYGSHVVDIHQIADSLEERGWYVNRQSEPRAIHLVISPVHERAIDAYLADLKSIAELVARRGGQRRESEINYYG